ATDKAELATLVGLYAMVSRMRMFSSPKVIAHAEGVGRLIIETYFAPNKNLKDLRDLIKTTHIDPLRDFSEACREDLQRVGAA
ncbi:MAG: hypothetical protein JOY81_06925, partial [Alphaproteobacteria bacterium]|nr:hypothetical protein [Alphaproteobacteria bacterium]